MALVLECGTPVVGGVSPRGGVFRSQGDCSKVTEFTYAGYADWTTFTSNCCCMQGKNGSRYTSVEEWVCNNGIRKASGTAGLCRLVVRWSRCRLTALTEQERARVDGTESGLSIRGFCSKSFNDGICPTQQCTGSTIQVRDVCFSLSVLFLPQIIKSEGQALEMFLCVRSVKQTGSTSKTVRDERVQRALGLSETIVLTLCWNLVQASVCDKTKFTTQPTAYALQNLW